MKTKCIEEAMKYAMVFYSIQEHELNHTTDNLKRYIENILAGGRFPNLSTTEKKLIMLATRYLGEKR